MCLLLPENWHTQTEETSAHPVPPSYEYQSTRRYDEVWEEVLTHRRLASTGPIVYKTATAALYLFNASASDGNVTQASLRVTLSNNTGTLLAAYSNGTIVLAFNVPSPHPPSPRVLPCVGIVVGSLGYGCRCPRLVSGGGVYATCLTFHQEIGAMNT